MTRHGGFDEVGSLESWLIKNSPSFACVLPMPFALNYKMVKGFPSEAFVRIGGGSGYGVGGMGGDLKEFHGQSLIRRYFTLF